MQNESSLNDFLSSLKPGESMILRVSSLLFNDSRSGWDSSFSKLRVRWSAVPFPNNSPSVTLMRQPPFPGHGVEAILVSELASFFGSRLSLWMRSGTESSSCDWSKSSESASVTTAVGSFFSSKLGVFSIWLSTRSPDPEGFSRPDSSGLGSGWSSDLSLEIL